MRTCDVEGCDRPWVTQKLCRTHYERWWRTGKVNADMPIGGRRTYVRKPGRISVIDVMQILNVSDTTVRRMADSGRLPVERDHMGTRWFDPADVQRVRDAGRPRSWAPRRVVRRAPELSVPSVPLPHVAQPRRTFDLEDTDEL